MTRAGWVVIAVVSAISILYLAGFLWFRSYSFSWTDLDGNLHISTIDHFRDASRFQTEVRWFAAHLFRPLISLDRMVTGREFDDEM